MAEQGQLTIYDKTGTLVAATGNNTSVGQATAQFPHHCAFGYKDGVAKKAFFYTGPDGSTNACRGMSVVEQMAYNGR